MDRVLTGLHYLVAGCVTLSLLMFFLAENGRANAFPTYLLGVAVIALLAFSETRRQITSVSMPVLTLTCIFLAYLSGSAWWSDSGGFPAVLQYLGYALLILAFILGLVLAHNHFASFLPLLLAMTVAAATVSGAYSIYLHLALPEYQPLPEPRLYGLGRLSNPVISATSYGFASLLSVWLILQRQDTWHRLLAAVCILILLTAMALSGSRTAWLALGLAAGTGFAMNYRDRALPWFALTLVATGLIAVAAVGLEDLTKRALSFRPEIWSEFVSRTLAANPILGVGSGSASHWVTPVLAFKHPHSIFVSAFYFGGLTGLLLLVALFAACIRHLFRADASLLKTLASMTLVYGITVGLLDGDNVLTKIDYLWWIMWFPVGMVVTCSPSALDGHLALIE